MLGSHAVSAETLRAAGATRRWRRALGLGRVGVAVAIRWGSGVGRRAAAVRSTGDGWVPQPTSPKAQTRAVAVRTAPVFRSRSTGPDPRRGRRCRSFGPSRQVVVAPVVLL